MDRASAAARVVWPIDAGLLAAAAQAAAEVVGGVDEPSTAIEAAVDALYDAVDGALPSVFVLEHGRMWLVAQRGYAVVPDGITVDRGITGRAIRLGRPQLAPDVRTDPDYVAALPGVVSELAIPLRSGRNVVGVLNVESERPLPDGAADALRPLARALTPLAESMRSSRTLDLAALARLFVHLGSLREPLDIAALAAASLPKVLPVTESQIVTWSELGAATELAAWRASGTAQLADARRRRDRTRGGRSERGVSGARARGSVSQDETRDPSSGFHSARTPESSGRSSASAVRLRTSTPSFSTLRPSSQHTSPPRSTPHSCCSESVRAP